MKLNILILILMFSVVACAQVPNGYYDDAEGLEGYELKTALKNIIDGHSVLSYGSLDNYYIQMDKDLYYENDATLLDIYSERPTSTDAYNYGFGESDQCGNYNSEADCWNKEHIFPQGFFNQQLPMRSDLHQVLPTDGYVNNRRSNYPFGEVGSTSWTSTNGSKVGNSVTPGFTGTVFEPIDEFKGDIARILLYFATRYENEVTSGSWDNPDSSVSNPLNGTNDQVYEDWYIDLLLSWNEQDPVSDKEIFRNNKVHDIQGNRNPFVDHPEWVNKIWNPGMSVNDVSTDLNISLYPNPVKNSLNIQSDEKIEKIEVYSISGKKVQSGKPNTTDVEINVSNYAVGTYMIKLTINGKVTSQKFIKK
ncbi:MAG: endonuclease [Moheibacter sp.]